VPAETLLREVEERRKKALEQLEAEYAAKKAEILKRTEDERAYIQESGRKEGLSQAEKERIRIVGATKLQAKKMVFDATEKMLEANIASVRKVLGELTQSKEYPALLARMVKYASGRLGKGARIIARPADEAIFKKPGVNVVSSGLNSIGGFKAESEDGTLELDLTFEEILRNHEEQVRASILGKD
jgi:V/A-type H+/Na+-transporting ATPase subunit E